MQVPQSSTRPPRSGLVTVVDVRPSEEFAAGHLPSAVNLPLEQLESRLHQLPRDQEIVAYCRGPYCVLAFEAVAKLREKGFKARRLGPGIFSELIKYTFEERKWWLRGRIPATRPKRENGAAGLLSWNDSWLCELHRGRRAHIDQRATPSACSPAASRIGTAAQSRDVR